MAGFMVFGVGVGWQGKDEWYKAEPRQSPRNGVAMLSDHGQQSELSFVGSLGFSALSFDLSIQMRLVRCDLSKGASYFRLKADEAPGPQWNIKP